MKSPDPVIVICLAVGAWVLYVMATALHDEPDIQEVLNFRAAVLQLESAGK